MNIQHERIVTTAKDKHSGASSPMPDKLGSLRIVSLFSGCGGMDLGFLGGFSFMGQEYAHTKFDLVWANELSPAACATYAANIGPVVQGDIWDHLAEMPEEAEVIVGGFPCQDISINGRGRGISGKRSGLYRAMLAAVERVHPKIFIAENVKALLFKSHQNDFKTVLNDFSSLGYTVQCKLHNAGDFGVPQQRQRIFIVGVLPGLPFAFPKPTTASCPRTAQEALHSLERLPEGAVNAHIWSKARPSAEQGSRRLKADQPAQTIRAECHGNIQFHYALDRRISMREAARLQSFPDNFLFPNGIRETERQIGNAVPPVLAWHIAQEVMRTLEGKEMVNLTVNRIKNTRDYRQEYLDATAEY